MTPMLAAPLTPFADALPMPQRLVAVRQDGRLSVRIRAGAHRFHRDLPESAIWGYDGTVPGPAIEAERGQPVTVQWRNELDGALPVVVTTTAPKATDTSDSCSSLPELTASCASARTTSPSARGPELRAQIAGDGQQGPGVAGQQRPVPYP